MITNLHVHTIKWILQKMRNSLPNIWSQPTCQHDVITIIFDRLIIIIFDRLAAGGGSNSFFFTKNNCILQINRGLSVNFQVPICLISGIFKKFNLYTTVESFLFMDCQNLPSSWWLNSIGYWFVALHSRTIYYFN